MWQEKTLLQFLTPISRPWIGRPSEKLHENWAFLSFLFWKNFFPCIQNDKIRHFLDDKDTKGCSFRAYLWRAQCFALLAPARARAAHLPIRPTHPTQTSSSKSSSNALLLALITWALLALLCISNPITKCRKILSPVYHLKPWMIDNQFLVLNPRPTERISVISWTIFNPVALSCSANQRFSTSI